MTETIIEEITPVDAYKCEGGCDLTDEEPEGPLYECSQDGTVFTRSNSADGGSHKCPDCHKFSAKSAEMGCDQCGEAAVEQIEAYACPECGNLHEEEAEARNCCTEQAKAERVEQAAKREQALTSVRVEVVEPIPGSRSITFCERCGADLSGKAYRAYIKPGTSFGITECPEHPVCQNAVETGNHCVRHQGPKTFKEAANPNAQQYIKHGAPDERCGTEPYIYITPSLRFGETPEPLPERISEWLEHRERERQAVRDML